MLTRRKAEFVSVLLCVAMLLGIAMPMYQKIIRKAESVTAEHNLASAQRAIDQLLMEQAGFIPEVNASNLSEVSPGISWRDLPPGSRLPAYGELVSHQKNVVFLVNDGDDTLCIFTVTLGRKIVYSNLVNDSWGEKRTVPYESGIPGLVTTAT